MLIHEQKMSSAKRRYPLKDVSYDMQLSFKQIISSYFRGIPILRGFPFAVFAINWCLNSAQDIKESMYIITSSPANKTGNKQILSQL